MTIHRYSIMECNGATDNDKACPYGAEVKESGANVYQLMAQATETGWTVWDHERHLCPKCSATQS